MWRMLAIALLLISFGTPTASAQPGADGTCPPNCFMGAMNADDGPPYGMHGHGRAFGPMGGGMMGGGMMGPGWFLRGVPTEGALAEKLALNSSQREKLAEIKDRAEREMISIQADLKLAHLDLEKAIRGDVRTAELDAAVGKVSSTHAAFLKSRVRAIAEERSVLTTAQRKTLEEYRTERPRREK